MGLGSTDRQRRTTSAAARSRAQESIADAAALDNLELLTEAMIRSSAAQLQHPLSRQTELTNVAWQSKAVLQSALVR